MRRATGFLLTCAVAAGTVGCSARLSRQDSDGPPAPSPPSAAAPSSGTPGAAPSTPPPPTPARPSSTTPSLASARTDVPDDAVLPAQQAVGDAVGTVAWTLPSGCAESLPSAPSTMRTVTDGNGRSEKVVRVQQVAAFPDAEAAVAEADRLAQVMDRCAADGVEDPDGLRSAGPVAVGAQGYGLAAGDDAGGASAPSGGFTVVVRRGNALTLLARTGGEVSVQGSRRALLADAQAAWERLCLYDRTAGCPPG